MSNSGHPGISRTNLVANSRREKDIMVRMIRWLGPVLTQPAAMGALPPALYAATSPEAEPMGYYGPKNMKVSFFVE